ncbi:MAG: hypothetical protein AABZ63_03385, partial [Actinomycetota bacterium]
DGGATFRLFDPGNNPDNPCLFYDKAELFEVDGKPFFQQQYPSVTRHRGLLVVAYEVGAGHFWRVSRDGIHWSERRMVPDTGNCRKGQCGSGAKPWEERHVGCDNDSADDGWYMRGSVPGLYSDGTRIYDFYGAGTYPASMGVLYGDSPERVSVFGPLFTAPYNRELCGRNLADAPGQFMAKYITSANVIKNNGRYYMTFEGQRRAGEWGLGLARAREGILSSWEVHPMTLGPLGPYVGVGHASFYSRGGVLYLYHGVNPVADPDAPTAVRARLVWSGPANASAAAPRMESDSEIRLKVGRGQERQSSALEQAKRSRTHSRRGKDAAQGEGAASAADDAFGDRRTE